MSNANDNVSASAIEAIINSLSQVAGLPVAKPKFSNVTVGTSADERIHLPKGMTYPQARDWLTKIEHNEDQIIDWSETIDAYPLDGALALQTVLESRFGQAVQAGATQRSWWGPGKDIPPFMIEVEVGVGETKHVPWGHFTIPIMPEHRINATITYKEKQIFFRLQAEVRRKYQPLLDELAQLVKQELQSGSIYKGKAFRLKFPTDEEMQDEDFNPNDFAPKFIDAATKKSDLILSEKVREQVDINIFTPVECTDLVRSQEIPLKRGILLEGRYGVGKTLTAAVLSALCVEHGWTYIYLENIRDLEKAMRFARRYEPAVIFAEDIDSVMEQTTGSRRDQEMNKILNTIDGVDMKRAEQMVVLTSNFVGRINKAMLRPGRLDAVISIEPPDEAAVIQLFRRYSRGLLDGVEDQYLLPAANVLAGQIPSVIREVVERSKLASIRRSHNEKRKNVELNGDDLLVAAHGIMTHIKLLEEPAEDTRSESVKAAAILAEAIKGSSSNGKGAAAAMAAVAPLYPKDGKATPGQA
jgi:transitional endoplasmic reticulum ATPase